MCAKDFSVGPNKQHSTLSITASSRWGLSCLGLIVLLSMNSSAAISAENNVTCMRNGRLTLSEGHGLKSGDKLVCHNKIVGGTDSDSFSIALASASSCMPMPPIVQVGALGTLGAGQTASIEKQVMVIFTGRITNESDLATGKTSTVRICLDTTADYFADYVDYAVSLPPPPISLARTTIDFLNNDPNNTFIMVTGAAGSVKKNATVTLRNISGGNSGSLLSEADGSFAYIMIPAKKGDELGITVTDQYGRTSTFLDKQNIQKTLETVVTALPYPAELGPCTTERRELLIESSDYRALQITKGSTKVPILTWASMIYPQASCTKGGTRPVVLFVHGLKLACKTQTDPPSPCPPGDRPPQHRGYEYVMETLAQHGFFTISVDNSDSGDAEMVLAYLDLLKSWYMNGAEDYENVLCNRPLKPLECGLSLDITNSLDVSTEVATFGQVRAGLVGHSKGGFVVSKALELNCTTGQPCHSIAALAGIAPPSVVVISKAPYLLLMGTADSDCTSGLCFGTYDPSFVNTGGSAGSPQFPKMAVVAYGADHLNFNKTWVDPAWGGNIDGDGIYFESSKFLGFERLTGEKQRKLAQATLAAFFRWHMMQGETGYREMFTSEHRFYELSEMTGYHIFSTFQDDCKRQPTVQDCNRLTVDDFQNSNDITNLLDGAIVTTLTAGNYMICKPFDKPIGPDPCLLPISPDLNRLLHQHTFGIQLRWTDVPATARVQYTTSFSKKDIRQYAYLSFRAAKRVDAKPTLNLADPNFQDSNLYVRLVDSAGHAVEVRSDQYGILKRPYSSVYSYLSGVRIPLDHFRQNGSALNLVEIVKVEFLVEGTGIVAIDDIEFGN